MSREIDLIPASYRERLKIQYWCHWFLFTLVLIVILVVLFRLNLNSQNTVIQATISTLQRDKSFNLQQQQKYNDLLSMERRLNKYLEILAGIRGGPSVQHILSVVDRVLTGDVWFSTWSFTRAGAFTEVRQGAVQTGYFIMIPQEDSNNGKAQTWKLDTHMHITGQAIDLLSFSNFVQALLDQAEIEDVKVENTQVKQYVHTQVIDFSIVIIINNQPRDQRV